MSYLYAIRPAGLLPLRRHPNLRAMTRFAALLLLSAGIALAQTGERAGDALDLEALENSGETVAQAGFGSLGERLAFTGEGSRFAPLIRDGVRRLESGDYAACLELVLAAGQDAAAADQPLAGAAFLVLAGRAQWLLGDYPSAIANLQQAVTIAEAAAEQDLLSAAHHALGLTYTNTQDHKVAARHFAEALAAAEKLGDSARIAYILNGAANSHLALRDYAAARPLYERALALREAVGDKVGAADSATNLGTLALLNGDPTEALAAYQKALAIYEHANQPRRLARGHRRIAAALRRLGRLDEALAELRVALAIAEPLGSQPVLAEIFRELARTHESRGEFRSALHYERRRASTRENLIGEQIRKRVVELDARFQAERRENEITRLRLDQEAKTAEIRRGRQQTAALAGGLALLAVLGGFVFLAQRARLRAERAAHAAEERARLEAEQAARLKSRLLQIAAHDLKAPLSAVFASDMRIEQRADQTATVVELARNIRTDTAHMGGLVREFLDSAAIEAGRLQLHRAPADLALIARNAVEDYRPLAEQKGQRIALDPEAAAAAAAGELPRVLADAARLRQILDNIIVNALKFTPSGGMVNIGLGRAGRWIYAEVRDNGPGLTPDDLARMFQPFQPLSATPTAKENSTGLGLFITRELVSMHDGLLEVESQPGQGATFRVLLPAAEGGGA
jgi:signal transduction histidine kinase